MPEPQPQSGDLDHLALAAREASRDLDRVCVTLARIKQAIRDNQKAIAGEWLDEAFDRCDRQSKALRALADQLQEAPRS